MMIIHYLRYHSERWINQLIYLNYIRLSIYCIEFHIRLLKNLASQTMFKVVMSQEERKSDPGILTQTFHCNFDF